MFVAAMPIALLLSVAQADSEESSRDRALRAESLYVEGVALYKAKNYQHATARFEEAYELFPSPNLAYNIGKSKEASGDIEGALKAYQICIDDISAPRETRDRAKERVALLERAKAVSRPPPETVRVRQTPQDANTALTETAPATRVEKGSSPFKWIFGAVGLGVAGTGAVFLGLGASDHGKVTDAKNAAGGTGVATLSYNMAESLIDRGTGRKTAGVGMLIGGGALLGLSALMFSLDGPDEDAVTVGATASEGGASVIIRGAL